MALPNYDRFIIGNLFNVYYYFKMRKEKMGKETVRHIILYFIDQLNPTPTGDAKLYDASKAPVVISNNITVTTLYIACPYMLKDLY